MKRTLCFLLALTLVFSLAITVSAESTTLTIEVPEASYMLNVPANQAIAYRASEASIGGITVSGTSGFSGKKLNVTVNYNGQFTNPDLAAAIHYSLKCKGNGADTRYDLPTGSVMQFAGNADGTLCAQATLADGSPADDIIVLINTADWEIVQGGTYSTTISFAASVTDN